MKSTKLTALLFVTVIISGIMFSSCKKENVEPQDNNSTSVDEFEFTSLDADKTTLDLGEMTTITATVKGENITYQWTTTRGTILGSGSQISYGTNCQSCTGQNTITCIATDENNNTDTKSIEVTVNE